MILAGLIAVLVVGGLAAWIAGKASDRAPRWIALAALAIDGAWLISAWPKYPAAPGEWIAAVDRPWIAPLGVRFHLAMDGLSLVLLALTFFLGLVAVLCSWTEIKERVGLFHFNLLWTLAGVVGVFTALDLFLFYFFWEMMLIPMYLLIALWGHEDRAYASIKFFLFTQAGGLLMMLAILGLAFAHLRATGEFTFDYARLLGTPLAPKTAMLLLLGFAVAFAVKLPAFPLHTWLPDAHTEAPTAGSVVLAGLLLKTGAYGLIRFAVPLFPEAARALAPTAMALGAVGIVYGAVLAFAQTDLKRLVAYTSVSHLGFVLLGVFAGNAWALQGAVMQMIAHGLSTGALFVLVGLLAERIHTRDLSAMGGLWTVAPRMGAAAMFFAMASLGLPGLGNFVAEVLVLVGSYRASLPLTAVATAGLVLATAYSLHVVQRAFHGGNARGWSFPDLTARETLVLAAFALALLTLGLFPQGVLRTVAPVVEAIQGDPGTAVAWGLGR